MNGFDKAFELKCEEYLLYLTDLASCKYSDCSDLDSLIQDSIMVLLIKKNRGAVIDHPKGFLSAVMKNKYNEWLRQKYRNNIVLYEYTDIEERDNDFVLNEESELRNEEYESVRRELGRLIEIYREVTVRHYVHGHSVGRIAEDLKLSVNTVKSRLSSARSQLKEGLTKMEKYSQLSYEPKKLIPSICGSTGFANEPFSSIRSPIEANLLILAYEKPISVRELSESIGIPAAYVEPIVSFLVTRELMGRTSGGLVYTRCFLIDYDSFFGDVKSQESFAEKYASVVWETVWKHIEPLTQRDEFLSMSEKQKATLILFTIHNILNTVVSKCDDSSVAIPERRNGGRWLMTGIVFEHGQLRDNRYDYSGPVHSVYSKNNNSVLDCRMYDYQSLFGTTHWGYQQNAVYHSYSDNLRLLASFLECDVTPRDNTAYDLIANFEELHILKRRTDGEIELDVPALTFEEAETYLYPAIEKAAVELLEIMGEDIKKLRDAHINFVPDNVDEREYFVHCYFANVYKQAQMLEIINKQLMPYSVEVGKTPIIYIEYRKKQS